jgi:CheY-like chemotaxis protein
MKRIEVLLVEDNAGDTVLMLQAFDHSPTLVKFHLARDGDQALQLLGSKAFEPDLVILDLNLPSTSGYAVLERYHPDHVPVVVFSSSWNPADARRSLELGASEFISKPAEYNAFTEVVRGMVEKWAWRREEGRD